MSSPTTRLAVLLSAALLAACAISLPDEPSPPQRAAQHLSEANAALKRDDPARALDEYRQAAAIDPSAKAAAGMGDALAAMRSDEAALAAYAAALERWPDSLLPAVGRARLNMRLERNAEALADLDRAVGQAPSDARVRGLRAAARIADGQLAGAVSDLEAALRIEPDAARRRILLARVLYDLGRYAESAEHLRLAARDTLDGGRVTLWRYLARLRAGEPGSEAHGELAAQRGLLERHDWPRQMLDFYLQRTDEAAVRAAAQIVVKDERRNRRCEADYFIAEWRSLQPGTTPSDPRPRATTDCSSEGRAEE